MQNRIKEWRLRRGLSAQVLAERIGTGRSTIVKLERGERRLTTEWMARLGSALDVAAADLMPPQALAPLNSGVVFAPVIGWSQARDARDHGLMRIRSQEAVPVPYNRETVVALEVMDDSMDRVAPVGASLVVDVSDVELVDKGVFAVALPPNGVMTFREYRDTQGPARLQPKSSNPKWEPLYLEGGPPDIIGKVVYTFHRLSAGG